MRVSALAIGLGVLLAAGSGGAAVERKAEPAARSTVPEQALARAITPQRLKAHLAALAADRRAERWNARRRHLGVLGFGRLRHAAASCRRLPTRAQDILFDFFRETKPTVFERVAPALRRYESGRTS
jgi:hypothetical protein